MARGYPRGPWRDSLRNGAHGNPSPCGSSSATPRTLDDVPSRHRPLHQGRISTGGVSTQGALAGRSTSAPPRPVRWTDASVCRRCRRQLPATGHAMRAARQRRSRGGSRRRAAALRCARRPWSAGSTVLRSCVPMRREPSPGTGKTARYTLTIPAAAAVVGVPRSTLYRWVAQGRLHTRSVDGELRVRPVDAGRLGRIAAATSATRISPEGWRRLVAASVNLTAPDEIVALYFRTVVRLRELRGRVRELEVELAAARAREPSAPAAQ